MDDSADPEMIKRMHDLRDNLSYRMPIHDFIKSLKVAVQLDSRTRLGGDLQRCLLWNAAHRLEVLAENIDPNAPYARPLRERMRDALAVLKGRAVVTFVK